MSPTLVVVLLAGCLPRHAVGRHEPPAAPRYHVTMGVSAAVAGDLPAESWRVEGDVIFPWTRTFRDGTLGHAVLFEGMRAPDGAVRYDRAVVEVRSFPSGEIVAIDGLGPWAGAGGHLELLDLLWPALSPRVPDSAAGEPVRGTAAWPILFPAGPGPRLKAEGTWTPRGGEVVWRAALGGESGFVRVEGSIEGAYTRAKGAVRAAAIDSERRVTTHWAGGAQHEQSLAVSVRLAWAEDVAPPPLDGIFPADDPAADARPIRFLDGREVSRAPVTLAQLPFLLVGEPTAAVIRATLVEPATGP